MNNMDRFDRSLQEELDRVYLRHMMHRYMQEYGEQLLKHEKSLPDTRWSRPSRSHRRSMEQALRGPAPQPHVLQVRRMPRRFVPVTAVMIVLLVASLVTAGAYREQIYNFLRVHYGSSAEYSIQQEVEPVYLLHYVPEGFMRSLYDDTGSFVRMYYQDRTDPDRSFFLCVFESGVRVSINTERADYIEEVEIGGRPGDMISQDGITNVIWADIENKKLYVLQSELDRKELVRIAEGVELMQ